MCHISVFVCHCVSHFCVCLPVSSFPGCTVTVQHGTVDTRLSDGYSSWINVGAAHCVMQGVKPGVSGGQAWCIRGSSLVYQGVKPGVSRGQAWCITGSSLVYHGVKPGVSRGQAWCISCLCVVCEV